MSGIIVGGGTGTAIVRGPADPSATRLMLGSTVGGWTVAAIQARAIVLRRENRSVTIELQSPAP